MWDHIINIYTSELLSTKTKKSRINKLLKKITIIKKKKRITYIIYLIISLQKFLKS